MQSPASELKLLKQKKKKVNKQNKKIQTETSNKYSQKPRNNAFRIRIEIGSTISFSIPS